jgi:hypothetical protein
VTKTAPVALLPFEAYIPDPRNPKRKRLTFWNIPDDADYGEACRVGSAWAAALIDSDGAAPPHLRFIVDEIAKSEARLPRFGGSRGFAVGFFSVFAELAWMGADRCGSAKRFVDFQEARYREAEAHREAERGEASKVRVARMNAGKGAKRAKRDAKFQGFMTATIATTSRGLNGAMND